MHLMGICVLGNRVIVSQSPYIWAFYDDNGDDKADRKEVFEGNSGNSTTMAYMLSFGPDGSFHFIVVKVNS